MNRKEWMRSEIAAWRSEGVIGDEVAERLLGRYAESGTRISWGAMLAGAFGALLIGLGIIALFAANWDSLGRGARAAISLAPVVVCGGVAALAAWKGWRTMSLWEPLGILWTIATGAAACLVAQTYQVGGSVPGLILFVALLTLPIAWITHSVKVMALWPIFAIAWGIVTEDVDGRSWIIVLKALGLMALSIPAFVAFQRRDINKVSRVTGQWMLGLVYALGTAILIVNVMPQPDWSTRAEVYIGIFWACSLAVLLAGVAFKIPAWTLVATLVAAGAAMPTTFEELWIYGVAIILSVVIVAYGIRKVRLSYTNIGAALFLWLVLAKFFESQIDFTVKGLVLIGAGVALTALNVVMIKCKRNVK